MWYIIKNYWSMCIGFGAALGSGRMYCIHALPTPLGIVKYLKKWLIVCWRLRVGFGGAVGIGK